MHTKDTDHDLSALFGMEDEMFTAEPFTKNIMTSIRRQKFRRRIMLSVATLLGGVLAGPQIITLLNGSDDRLDTIARTLSALPDQLVLSQNMSASSLAAVTLIVVSAAMISVLERA